MSSPFSYSRVDLPEGWHKRRLGSLLQFRNGQDISGTDIESESYPVYGSGGEFKRTNQYLFDGPSILFGRKGTIDKPLLVDGRFWTVDTMFYTVPGPDVDPRFVYYWALIAPLSVLSTNTAVPSMTSTDLAQLYLAVPPLPAQRAIADYLDRETAEIDAMRADMDEMERLLEERRASIVESAFSVLRDSGCSYRKLGYVAQFRNGQETKGVENADGAYPVYGSGGEFKRADSYLFDGPSVLFGRKGTLDKPLLVNGRFWTVDTMYYTILSADVCPSFLHKWATTIPFEMHSTDTALPSMTSTVLSQLRIPLLPLAEQRRIADEIDRETAEIDSMLGDITKLRDLLVERRSAVISAAVTGEIDIPVSLDDKDEPHA